MAQLLSASVAKEWKIYGYPVLGFGNVCVHPSMREVDETAGMGRFQKTGVVARWMRRFCAWMLASFVRMDSSSTDTAGIASKHSRGYAGQRCMYVDYTHTYIPITNTLKQGHRVDYSDYCVRLT